MNGSGKDSDFECFFIGELSHGTKFADGLDEGFFVEFCIQTEQTGSAGWIPLNKLAKDVQQTQTAFCEEDDSCVWNHPIDLHFTSGTIEGWPRLRIIVWRLSSEGILGAHSYGTMVLPNAPGHFELKCQTWSIRGSSKEEIVAKLLGPRPQLLRADVIDKNAEQRNAFQTVSSGVVHFNLDVIFRNAQEHDIKVIMPTDLH